MRIESSNNHSKMTQKRYQSGPILTALIVFGTLGLLGVNSYTVNRFGDVLIRNDGETFQCDRIICPNRSVRCQVTKSPDESDPNFIFRRNICYGASGDVLLQNSTRERVLPGQTQQVNVIVSDDGYSSSSVVLSNGGRAYIGESPIDGEALRQSIQQNVQRTLDDVSRNLEQSLGGLWRGFG